MCVWCGIGRLYAAFGNMFIIDWTQALAFGFANGNAVRWSLTILYIQLTVYGHNGFWLSPKTRLNRNVGYSCFDGCFLPFVLNVIPTRRFLIACKLLSIKTYCLYIAYIERSSVFSRQGLLCSFIKAGSESEWQGYIVMKHFSNFTSTKLCSNWISFCSCIYHILSGIF